MQVRSRVQCYDEGEKNLKYFVEMIKQNAAKKSITSLKIGRIKESFSSKILQYVSKFYLNYIHLQIKTRTALVI